MDDKCSSAINFVLKNEGGFSDDPNDAGGATNFGISLRFLREITVERLKKYGIFVTADLLNVDTIRNLTKDQAILIYKGEFWDQAAFHLIDFQPFCNYVFDMCVSHGIAQGIKMLQRAIWSMFQERNSHGIADDGHLGELTLVAINSTLVCLWPELATALVVERAGYMRLLVALDPKKKEFLDGWLDRCYRT